MRTSKHFDVIIVGGSYAGLSAAMALGRSLRKVLLIDSGLPCNLQTPHSHNFITQDGEKPAVIAAKAKEQVLKYDTVDFLHARADSAKKTKEGFRVMTHSGEAFSAKKLVFASGIKDRMPDIAGFAECWGISVVHCPYCHGYELRNRRTAILANGDRAVHLASLVSKFTDTITLIPSGKAAFTPEQRASVDRHRIPIIEGEISEIVHQDGLLTQLLFTNGNSLSLEAIYAALPFSQHSDIPETLGCELTEQGYIRVDAFQKTTIEGVFACGDNAGMMRSIANAVYSGNLTGAVVNKELADEQF